MSEVSTNIIGLKEGIWELTDLDLNPSLRLSSWGTSSKLFLLQ